MAGYQTIEATLAARLETALPDGPLPEGFRAQVTAASDTRHGDYQSNAAMLLAKALRKNPRALADEIISKLDIADLCDAVEVAGAGFINFRIKPSTIADRLQQIGDDDRLGVPSAKTPRKVVIDFSAPNVAKPMHVGHIRSTMLGDSLARIARFLGHEVITDNHIGDWGTQFGKVIYGWKHLLNEEALAQAPVNELVRLYREVNRMSEADPAILEECKTELVKLQRGDEENLTIWQKTIELSQQEFDAIYALLDVKFDETLGESFYNDQLAPLVDRLLKTGIARISEGAACVFFDEESTPCLIRKSDGGFLYATTDLATLEYRVEQWNPDAIWYVTGAPQKLHFEQIFAVAAQMGIRSELHHIAFGSILGEDRKLMKTRSGENVQLRDVLDEAIQRARALVEEKNPDFTEKEKAAIARTIGLGAVKYAELSQHRMSDYVFSWDKMLSFQGNTAPYLQNAYVRIQSIFRKAEVLETPPSGEIVLTEAAESALALRLLQYGEVLPGVLDDFRPNLLANYLYDLANKFHAFYEACPVLKAEGDSRATRLCLCEVTAKVIRHGLGLLGIHVPDRM